MDLTQKKLTKSEWDFLEIPLCQSELEIMKMIENSKKNLNIKFNKTMTLIGYMKFDGSNKGIHYYFYNKYFEKDISKDIKEHNLQFKLNLKDYKKIKLKKADMFRIKNSDRKMDKLKNLFEFVLLENVSKFLEKKNPYYYYTLTQLMRNSISNLNMLVNEYIQFILEHYEGRIKKSDLIKNSHEYIERNNSILKYKDFELYHHQKSLLAIANKPDNSLIQYIAPTGTGKTLTPIGIKKKIVFVCAAKHIGLQLAKACISLEIPIAVAFGCLDPSDIRLHYFAAVDFTKNRRTGHIFRVDNSNGSKVEIIISDIQSYIPSMNYMLAFNEPNDLVWYWDEPTITLDYENHEFHEILKKNWEKNIIPNIILSSATLPYKEDIMPMLLNYKNKFKSGSTYEVINYDCRKTIPIIDANSNIVVPHLHYDDYNLLKKSVKHIEKNKTILRHIDVKLITEFILYVNKNDLIKDRYKIDNYFQSIKEIDIISIKLYYLKLLSKINSKSFNKYKKKNSNDKKIFNSVIKITTDDAYTLTDGPTIFLTNDVKKIALFYLKVSNIPNDELENILKLITYNEEYKKELEKVMFNEKERLSKMNDRQLSKVDGDDCRELQEQDKFNGIVRSLKAKMKLITLNKRYIPNSKEHLNKWHKNDGNNYFTSDVDEDTIEDIILLNMPKEWKILLMMGIGVFQEHDSNNLDKNKLKDIKKYSEIMKRLAEKQKLYLIIASSDYIYGTNYQFCHGYLSKDLLNMTQEKMIQAFGRIGRQSTQMDYTIRLRNDDLIDKILLPEKDKMEVRNMNALFGY
jgi:hypothetical protein